MGADTPQSTPEELHELRRTIRAYADVEIRPTATARDRDESFPDSIVTGLAELGVIGASVPHAYGGAGLDDAGYRVVMEELGAADSSLRSLVSVNVGLFAKSLMAWGTEEQKARWLPGVARGELGAFGLTEPDAGSNPSQMQTRAVKERDGWRINGAKIFITNGSRGAVTMIFARAIVNGEDQGITCFLTPQDAPGYVGSPIHGKLGLRSGDTAEIALSDVYVDEDAVLGDVGHGMKVALSALENGRFSLAAGAAGIAQEALRVALEYSLQREQFGGPIAAKQLVQEHLAAMHVDIKACEGLLDQLLHKRASGERTTLETSTAKLFCTEASVRCADRAVQIHGGYGYIDEYPVQRLLRDARVTTLYEGTSQIQHLIIGRLLTGINAF